MQPTQIWADMRYASRWLRKNAGFTVTAVLTLGLGIAANSTVYTIMSAVYLRGLPVDKPEQIVSVASQTASGTQGVSYLDFVEWQRASHTFTGLAAYDETTMNLADDALVPDRYDGAFVSASAFRLLGEQPLLGRGFAEADDRAGATPTVILGHAVWQNRYAGDPKIIGRRVRINGMPSTVIGVIRAGFRFPTVSDLWQPLAMLPGMAAQPRDARHLNVFGRLVDGGTIAQARAELDSIAARLAVEYPNTNKDLRSSLVPFVERYVGPPAKLILSALMGAVGFVLLIACANVANLLLSCAANRTREMSIRISLGATRGRIIRQLLVESGLVAILAGAVALALSAIGVAVFGRFIESAGARQYWMDFSLDRTIFGFLAIVCLGTLIVFGLAPALHTSKPAAHRGPRVGRWTSLLVVSEIALTLVLLTGAGFMIRTLVAHYQFDHAFNTSNLLTMRLDLPAEKYGTPDQRIEFHRRLEERLAGIPTVSSVAFASAVPGAGAPQRELSVDGQPQEGETLATVSLVNISPGYFDTMGLRILRGRAFDRDDGSAGHETAIVNQRLVDRYFPNEDPIGQRIRLVNRNARGQTSPVLTVVGVAPTVRQEWTGLPDPVVFAPYRLDARPSGVIIVRANLDTALAAPLLREEVRTLDSDLPLVAIMTMDDLLARGRWFQQIFSGLTTVFALIALVLSGVGLYGVTAYGVAQRTKEIGVRVALGAQRSQVLWLFLRRALLQLAWGFGLGTAAAFAVFTLLRTIIFDNVGPDDPITIASIIVVLLCVSLAASVFPALRAMRLSPVSALRHE